MKQHTIRKPITVKGVGLHTGKAVTMTFKPAPVNHGLKFQRIDLDTTPVISADVNKVYSLCCRHSESWIRRAKCQSGIFRGDGTHFLSG